jgi:hypothetical protein
MTQAVEMDSGPRILQIGSGIQKFGGEQANKRTQGYADTDMKSPNCLYKSIFIFSHLVSSIAMNMQYARTNFH